MPLRKTIPLSDRKPDIKTELKSEGDKIITYLVKHWYPRLMEEGIGEIPRKMSTVRELYEISFSPYLYFISKNIKVSAGRISGKKIQSEKLWAKYLSSLKGVISDIERNLNLPNEYFVRNLFLDYGSPKGLSQKILSLGGMSKKIDGKVFWENVSVAENLEENKEGELDTLKSKILNANSDKFRMDVIFETLNILEKPVFATFRLIDDELENQVLDLTDKSLKNQLALFIKFFDLMFVSDPSYAFPICLLYRNLTSCKIVYPIRNYILYKVWTINRMEGVSGNVMNEFSGFNSNLNRFMSLNFFEVLKFEMSKIFQLVDVNAEICRIFNNKDDPFAILDALYNASVNSVYYECNNKPKMFFNYVNNIEKEKYVQL